MDDLLTLIPDIIRNRIAMFPESLGEGKVEWYCFLIHEYPKDPDNVYFHIRFTKAEGKDVEGFDFIQFD